MLLLDDPIRAYAWGAIDGLSSLVGTEPSGGPEAELWVGTHPTAPSMLADDPTRSLASVIAADPARALGADVVARFGPDLPFLLKVLAVGAPLSLQAHPSPEQADRGFRREERAGIALDASHRTYRDRSAKPEMLVALVDTFALAGFRPPAEARRFVAALGAPALEPLVDALGGDGAAATGAAMAWLLGLSGPARRLVADAVAAAVAAAVEPGADRPPAAGDDLDEPVVWVRRLATDHPGDPAILAPLLLNLVHLAPGEAVHLSAGNLHAYLQGAGVELMAASDNVLRGGLTPKHVDVEELLDVLAFEPGLPPAVPARPAGPGIVTYDAGEAAFCLTALRPGAAGRPLPIPAGGPRLLLATGGAASALGAGHELVFGAGRAVFVAADEGRVEVSGPATIWCATTGGRSSR